MSVQGAVILDEQDASVVFTGQWDHYADPVQYKGISTGSKSAGTSCSVNFTGTSILVATTVARNGSFSLQFNLDGQLYTNSTTGLNDFANLNYSYHDATFSVEGLKDGDHQLTISNTMNTDTTNIYIDYFLYSPSSHTNMSNLNLFIDDRDPSLVYTGNWILDTADSDFRHTSRFTSNISDTISIPFTGKLLCQFMQKRISLDIRNGIQFYGLINNGTVGDMLLAEFVLDGTSTTTYAPPAQTSIITYNNKMYDSGLLSQGSHKLVVTPKNDHRMWIDYLLVHQAATTDLVQATTSANPASTMSSVVVSSKHNAISAGAIAGTAIGALLSVLILIGLVIFLLRRRRRASPKPPAKVNNNDVGDGK